MVKFLQTAERCKIDILSQLSGISLAKPEPSLTQEPRLWPVYLQRTTWGYKQNRRALPAFVYMRPLRTLAYCGGRSLPWLTEMLRSHLIHEANELGHQRQRNFCPNVNVVPILSRP